MIFDKKYLPN
jgi:hypothetical protein